LPANAPLESPLRHCRVLVAGLGNIGSPLPALLARTGAGLVRLIDRDRVEEKNLAAQDYRPADVGRFKADVHAERLRELFPGCRAESYPVDLEDLPAGLAEVDLVLGALDSRRARQVLAGDLAWPLGVPVIDGGVGDGGLGRVQVFVPGAGTACLECTWGSADYRLASAEYPCVPGGQAAAAPTGAPAYLGSFTASLMATEAVRLLGRSGEPSRTEGAARLAARPEESYEIAFDLSHLALRRFALRRNPRCRHDHAITTKVLPTGETVADLLGVLERRFGPAPVRLQARRGLGRFLTVEALRARREEPLAALGLVAGDRVRAVCPDGSAWLCMPLSGGQ
jgi:molybdopterin/thiamine biosynthesis adenylyltransferase